MTGAEVLYEISRLDKILKDNTLFMNNTPVDSEVWLHLSKVDGIISAAKLRYEKALNEAQVDIE